VWQASSSHGLRSCTPVAICVDGGNYLLESFREQSASFIIGQTMGAGHGQRMRPGGQTDDDPGNLTGASGTFKRHGQWCGHEIGCHTGADLRERTWGTYRRRSIRQRILNPAAQPFRGIIQ
jgi:hypothetical protein